MTLINCETCNGQIAKKAKNCPHCGAKRTTRGLFKTALIVTGVFIVLGLLVSGKGSTGNALPECDSYEGLQRAKMRFVECYLLNGGDEVKDIQSPNQQSYNEQNNSRACSGLLVTSQGRQYPAVYNFSVLTDGEIWTDIKIQTPSGTDYSTCN